MLKQSLSNLLKTTAAKLTTVTCSPIMAWTGLESDKNFDKLEFHFSKIKLNFSFF